MISEEARAKLQDMVEYECGRVEAGQEERVNRLSMLLCTCAVWWCVCLCSGVCVV